MMSFDEIRRYIDLTKDAFPDVTMVVFTGGECTLLGEDLLKSIDYASKKGYKTRIVTNGSWATTVKRAQSILDSYADVGLSELNLSTGDEHVKFVPISKIILILRLASLYDTLSSIAVNIESLPDSSINAGTLENDKDLSSLPKEQREKLVFLQSSWILYRDKSHNGINQDKDPLNLTHKRGCSSILDTITMLF